MKTVLISFIIVIV